MPHTILQILKCLGIALLALAVLAAALLFWLSRRPFVPAKYTQTVQTGGPLEAKYLAMGPYQARKTAADAPGDWKTFTVWYPAELEDAQSAARWPAVVFVNGTGVPASKYPALFEHLASWGFLVLGNEDPGTFSGDSADATLAMLLEENENPDSLFYQKVDTACIGLSGHSQGGVRVFNAVAAQPHGGRYACAVSLSPTDPQLAEALKIPYDAGGMNIPTLLLASSQNDVIAAEGMNAVYAAIAADKAMALRAGADHGQMLYAADGYVTAWFRYWLQGDETAGRAFFGDAPELAENPLYQNPAAG